MNWNGFTVLSSLHRPELNSFPNVALPFYVRSTGHFRRAQGSFEAIPPGEKPFVQFYWCIAGEGEMECAPGAVPCRIRKGDFFYRLPFEQHFFRSTSPDWEYRWVAFDGPGAADFMRSYSYPAAPFPAGECPLELFQEIDAWLQELTPYSWRKMVVLVSDVLAAAGGTNREETLENRQLQEAIRICRSNFPNPNLNINALSERLGVSRTTLLRLFRRKMNMTPSDYLLQLRVQRAVSLLRETRYPLNRIAELSGWNDSNYFCRIIRHATGRTPGEIRMTV